MRSWRMVALVAGLGLVSALAGCGATMTTSSTPATTRRSIATSSIVSGAAATGAPAADVSYTLIQEPDQGYVPVYDFIATATTTLDMTMYALVDAQATAALVAAVNRGVIVRVLLDGDPVGGGGPAGNQPAYDQLTGAGATVGWSWPDVMWHQKSIVIDGTKVAIMTTNLDAAYYSTLRDFIVITDNPATVAGIAATFNTDFANTGSPPAPGVTPEGSELIWSPGAEVGLVNLIKTARPGTTIYAENEQLDSPVIEQAFVDAVTTGVTVNLVMSYSASFADGFNTLVAGGVHVNLYPSTAPLYIQAKTLSVNGDTVYVGSINFVTESTNADRNVGIITKNAILVEGLIATMERDFAGAPPYLGGAPPDLAAATG